MNWTGATWAILILSASCWLGATSPESDELNLGLPPLPGAEEVSDKGEELELGLPPVPERESDTELELELPSLPGMELAPDDAGELELGLPPLGTDDSGASPPPDPGEIDGFKVGADSGGWTYDLGGYAGTEASVFMSDALDSRQDHHFNASAVLEPEFDFRHRDQNITLRFVPFGRIDQNDSNRSHLDIRELSFLKEFENADVLLGLSHVFWGTTEAVHWVDVINQTDLVEDLDQEEKLGQPMVNANFFTDLGRFSFFVLPYFRERTFPGPEGRLRIQPYVDADRAHYESSAEEWHTDLAIRWSRNFGDLDLGLSYFWGTTREPVYGIDSRSNGEPRLLPLYEIVHQPALDLSYTWEDWLFKGEAIYRNGQRDGNFFRCATGFEYTFYGILDSAMDLGLIGEFLYDSAGNNEINPFEHDIAYGLRWTFNDLRDTSLLASAITDIEDASTFFSLEANMNFGAHWVARAEVRAFANIPAEDYPLNGLRRDSYLLLGLDYHF